MSGAPLYELLQGLCQDLRFHTPGHKGRLDGIFAAIAPYDTTETALSDDLYRPTGAILQAETLAKKYFETALTLFSAGGATLCIQTAMTFFYGKKVLIERGCHVSVFNAAALLDIEPVFIYNNTDELPLPITPEQIKDALSANPDAAAIFLTSPNYYGRTADLKSIKKICEDFGVLLCVDNSHGTHLFATDRENCPQKNSDICIDSAHKTLPVLTGGAFLHINFAADRLSVKEAMRLFGSTSPSFPVLASLDYARSWLENGGEEKIRKAATRVEKIKNNIPFETLDAEPLRLTVVTKNAKGLAALLLEKGIVYEMATDAAVVLLLSPFNTEAEYETLEKFFLTVDFKPEKPDLCRPTGAQSREVSYVRATLSPFETVDNKDAKGRIAARNVLPYPPGIPVLLAGEKIICTDGLPKKIKVIK